MIQDNPSSGPNTQPLPTGYYGYPLNATNGQIGPDQVPGSPFFPASSNVPHLATIFGHRWLYGMEGPNGTPGPEDIIGFSIDPATGTLSRLPGAISSGTFNDPEFNFGINALIEDPRDRFLFAPTSANLGPMVFRVNQSTGGLTQTWPPPGQLNSGIGVAAAAVDLSGTFLYGLTFAGDLVTFHVAEDGSLQQIGSPQPMAMYPKMACTCFVADPNRKYLYAVSPGSDDSGNYEHQIYGFSIDGNSGALTPINGSPFTTGDFPKSIAMSPSGRHLYVANGSSVSAYARQDDGALVPVPGSPFQIVQFGSAGRIEIAPSGEFAYIAINDDSTAKSRIAVFSIDASTGALTATGSDVPGGWDFVIAQPK